MKLALGILALALLAPSLVSQEPVPPDKHPKPTFKKEWVARCEGNFFPYYPRTTAEGTKWAIENNGTKAPDGRYVYCMEQSYNVFVHRQPNGVENLPGVEK